MNRSISISMLALISFLHGCGGTDNSSGNGNDDTTNSTPENSQTNPNGRFRTTTPMRYLLENHRGLNDEQIRNYFVAFNNDDLSTIRIYESWGSYLHYRAC